MSPEFGRTGIKGLGSIDFFLAPNQWGIEFTRDGNRIEEHYRRFLPHGKYHSWVRDRTFVDWVLIDFRVNLPIKVYSGKLPLHLTPTKGD